MWLVSMYSAVTVITFYVLIAFNLPIVETCQAYYGTYWLRRPHSLLAFTISQC